MPDATSISPMNPFRQLLRWPPLLMMLAVSGLHAQTLDWGNDVFGDVVDSSGNPLGNGYLFELGAFDAGFIPDETNIHEWVGHWNVFDRAAFNPSIGYFASSVQMLPDGTSDSPYFSEGSGSFEGLNAYLFVRNSDLAGPLSEWMLARAANWVFPVADDCCPGDLSIEWSLADLGDETPVFGSQQGNTGAGEVSVPGHHDLQTHTFVPEPAAALLWAAGFLAAAARRRRPRPISTLP